MASNPKRFEHLERFAGTADKNKVQMDLKPKALAEYLKLEDFKKKTDR